MNLEYSPYIMPLVVAAVISSLAAVYAWSRRTSKGALALFLMSLCITEWTIGYALEIAGADLATKYVWGVIQYFGIALVPYGWLMFSISYTDLLKSFSRRFLVLTGLIPTITILLAITTKWHGLIWTEYHINQEGSFSALGVSYGSWFWVNLSYSYILLLIGTILLVRTLFNKQGTAYRGRTVALLIAALTPWIGNALYLSGNSPIPHLDLTPFAFTITVVALARTMFEDLLTTMQVAENELAIARRIQSSFLPDNLAQVDGWDIDVRFHSAREVAGDFYDVFPVSSGKRLGLVVADVCDKGVGAAMYMAIFRTLIRAYANINIHVAANLVTVDDKSNENLTESMVFRKQKVLSVGAQPLLNAIQMTNQYIARNHGSSNMFATVFFGVLNPQDGKLIYINAGHEPPIVVSEGKIVKRLEPTGPAVGLMEGLTFEIAEIELKPGDLVFAYTDGVLDARDMNKQSFSEERLIAEINKNINEPKNILREIMKSLNDHIAKQDQYDDLTLMTLYREK